MLFIGIKQPMKQNSKITKTAYPDEKNNNQPVHCHLVKTKTSNQPVQKKEKKVPTGTWYTYQQQV